MTRRWKAGCIALIVAGFGTAAVAQYHYNNSPQPNAAVLMKVPLSGASWQDPTASASDPELLKEIKGLREEMRELIKLLKEAAGPDPGQGAAVRTPQHLIEALNTCVDCHSSVVAPKKGEGFVLFTTQKNPETEKEENVFRDNFARRELRNIQREVSEGNMPRRSSGKKLTKEQKDALLEEVRARISKLDADDKRDNK